MMKKEIIYDKTAYKKALLLFEKYKPVKVKRELKNDFLDAVTKHLFDKGDYDWGCTIYPLVRSYKFKRTS